MNKHRAIPAAIPSCEMARTLSFIFDRFDGNSSAGMLEKSTSNWIRRGKPVRKNMYYHYSAFLSSRLDLLQSWSPRRSFNFPPTFACSPLLYFHFWFASLRSSFASSNWSTDIAMVLVYSYLKELHQGRCLLADQLSNWVASSSHLYNPAKVFSVDWMTS